MSQWIQIAKNVNKVFAPRLSHFRIESNRQNSIVKVEDSGLSLLLGRNGSGKTQLIQAIKNWAITNKNPVRAFPVFRLPTSSDLSEWRNYLDQLKKLDFVKEEAHRSLSIHGEDVSEATHGNYDYVMEQILQPAGIPMLQSLSRSLEFSKQTVHAELGNMNDEEVLHYFSFSESAVNNWRWRRERRHEREGNTFPYDWPEDSEIRSYACDYFLQHLVQDWKYTNIDHSCDGFNTIVPGWGRWFDDHSLASLVGPATEEFFERMSHVELESTTLFRLISRPREDGAYSAFEQELKIFIKSAEDEFPEESYPRQFAESVQMSFPGNLFFDSHLSNERFSSLIGTDTNPIEGLPKILDVTPSNEIDLFIQRVKKNLFRLVTLEHTTDGQDTFTVQLRGLDRLNRIGDSVSILLESTELNVSAVRISPVKINHLGGETSYWPPEEKREVPDDGWTINFNFNDEIVESFPIPDIHIFDQNRNEWTELNEASLGQQHVVCVLLTLAFLNELSRDSHESVLVLADEIDSRLHWTASTALMSAISQYLEEMDDGRGIVSTHSIPSLGRPELAGCATVFAERELSTFTYSSGRELDIEQFSTLLGTDPLDSIRLSKLVLLVEGQHDEDIIRKVVLNLVPDPSRVVIVNARGIYAWGGLMSNLLRHSEIPVLLIHDKRDIILEKEWGDFVQRYNNGEGFEVWDESSFATMYKELTMKTLRETGDDELEKLLLLIKDAVYEGDRSLANRMSIFGLDAHDIVDFLPIGDFFKGGTIVRPDSWEEAWRRFPTGKKMKIAAGISISSVVNSASKLTYKPHLELVRLATTITRLLGQS